MQKKLLFLTVFLFSFYVQSQVGIGTDMPNSSSQLDVEAKDKGILIPRVSLLSLEDEVTISEGNVESLLVFNTNNTGSLSPGYYYWYDAKWRRLVIAGESLNETVTFLYDNNDGTFVYLNENGQQAIFDANTVTYTNHNDGSYTFTNDNGDSLTIDVVGDVVTNIQNQGDIYDEIINILNTNSDVFTDNGDGTFTHTAVDGTQLNFDANTVTYTNHNDGSYTFTNDNGDSLTIDVVGDVVTNIQNQGDIYDEIINILNTNSDVFTDNGDGTFTHTAVDGTQLNFDANTVTYTNHNDGSYTFTNDNGDSLTIEYLAENGITKNNTIFQLGGNLIQPTTLTTTAINTLAIEGLEQGNSPTHDVVVMDAQGVLKKVKAAMPKFFYMPSILVPTSSDQVMPGDTYGVIDLYTKYQEQFGGTGPSPLVTNASNIGNTLPVLPANELNYYISWYDTSVFYNVSVSNTGILNYSVYNNSAVTESSFMNIVFEVK